jgi:hypothetical protein
MDSVLERSRCVRGMIEEHLRGRGPRSVDRGDRN